MEIKRTDEPIITTYKHVTGGDVFQFKNDENNEFFMRIYDASNHGFYYDLNLITNQYGEGTSAFDNREVIIFNAKLILEAKK